MSIPLKSSRTPSRSSSRVGTARLPAPAMESNRTPSLKAMKARPARSGSGAPRAASRVFGITPLADGRTYAYAADHAEPGVAYPDEKAELLRRFGDWHSPIPQLISAAVPETILHNDIYEIAEPLPGYHRGAVAILGDAAHAMTPHLGQGANQAMEDGVTLAALVGPAKDSEAVAAALTRYTALRAPRGADMVRRSHRMGALTQSTSRPKEMLRNLGMSLAGRLVPDLALRAMDPVVAWRPPQGP